MLLIRWIKNKEGRLVCAWGDVREMGASLTLALSSGKSQLTEIEQEEEESASRADSFRSAYPVLVWVNPERQGKSLAASVAAINGNASRIPVMEMTHNEEPQDCKHQGSDGLVALKTYRRSEVAILL